MRHGEASYPEPDVLSDDGGRLTARGESQARALAERLKDDGVVAVYTSPLGRAVETGAILAGIWGTTATAVDGLQELSVGDLSGRPHTDGEARRIFLAWLAGDLGVRTPGAETGAEVISRFQVAVEELADRHRGQTVVAVSHGGVMSLAVPRLAVNVSSASSRDSLLENCAVVPVEVDADGWRMTTAWPGRAWTPAEVGSEEPGADVVDAP